MIEAILPLEELVKVLLFAEALVMYSAGYQDGAGVPQSVMSNHFSVRGEE